MIKEIIYPAVFEFDEEENRYVAMHHPFTAPKEDGLEMLETDPSKVCARAYDMVLNGNEVAAVLFVSAIRSCSSVCSKHWALRNKMHRNVSDF